MRALPWTVRGARLHLPRDLDVAYSIGRMGAVTAYDVWPLHYGSVHTARTGLARLLKLGLVRTFERKDPSNPAWYSLTAHGATWVRDEVGCDDDELHLVGGIARMNLEALRVRNRFWSSLVVACRNAPGVELVIFRPEWELRRLRTPACPVVPDAMAVLADDFCSPAVGRAWMLEFDAGTERLGIWEKKGLAYARLRHRAPLYGASQWSVLALTPSIRRARTVATAVARAGAGSFVFVAVTDTLEDGRALDPLLWRASSLASSDGAPPTETLRSGEATPISDPDQRGGSAADPGVSSFSNVRPSASVPIGSGLSVLKRRDAE